MLVVNSPCRRIEDKMEAKGLTTTSLTYRLQPPPSSKRVPLWFPGWLIMTSGCEANNCWSSCMLAQDRLGAYALRSFQESIEFQESLGSFLDIPLQDAKRLSFNFLASGTTGEGKGNYGVHPAGEPAKFSRGFRKPRTLCRPVARTPSLMQVKE